MRYLHTILVFIGLAATSLLYAQVYTCDFESATERQEWHLNPQGSRPVTLENTWYMGKPGNFGVTGSHGLYISSDADSANAVYTAAGSMFTLAYRDMTMLTAGTYTITFDYRLGGADGAKMSVYWLPTSVKIASYTGVSPNYTTKQGVLIASALRGKKVWESYTGTFSIPATPGRLLFVWENSEGASINPPSACVDNINIYSGASTCSDVPQNVNYVRGTVTWQGTASQYEVCIYNTFTDTFEDFHVVNGTTWIPNPSSEGILYLYVRSVCAPGEYSAWVYTSAFVYIKGARCIDFYDIGDNPQNTGVCYTGDFDEFIRYPNRQGQMERVDFGYDSDESMHTIHTIPNEIDPNTAKIDGGLRTVPQGEIASIRLGAYTSSGRSARIEYKYPVQAGASDLLELKYAAVLQSGGHAASLSQGSDMQPTFRLEVLDGHGKPLSSSCSQFYFMPDYGATANWHSDPNASYGKIYWCDWSTVTISLREYIGQTLTIRLTATRCSYDTHFAYAYFTLGCRSGDLQGIACGDFSTDRFVAPAGFSYRWYKESEPNKPIKNAAGEVNYDTLHISVKDTAVYLLECHNIEDSTCYYTLVANPNPRFPVADVSAKISVANCQNMVTFDNKSYVAIVNREDSSLTKSDELVQDVKWHWGDNTPDVNSMDSQVTHEYPATGGNFVPYIVASMSDGVCQDTIFLDTLRLANLYTPSTDTLIHRCEGEGYLLPSKVTVYSDTLYEWNETNDYGCEATNSIRVQFHQNVSSTRTEELCEGGYVEFEGQNYTETGTYDVHLNTVYGCDSLLTLNLTILPQLRVEVPDTLIVCADMQTVYVPYEHFAGRMSGVAVRFSQKGVESGFDTLYTYDVRDSVLIPVPRNLRPNDYEAWIDFGAPDCPAEPVHVVVRVYYASSVIEQKNDLIALLNGQCNGGFEWIGYQWYCDGLPMEGATTSYIVVDDSSIGKEFYCLLTRPDGVLLPTCPITYVGGKTALQNTQGQVAVYPTLLRGGELIHTYGANTIKIVDIVGRVVATYQLPAHIVSTIPSPTETGVYTLITESDAIKIIVQ